MKSGKEKSFYLTSRLKTTQQDFRGVERILRREWKITEWEGTLEVSQSSKMTQKRNKLSLPVIDSELVNQGWTIFADWMVPAHFGGRLRLII